ncbi:MAG: septal ring lytic transglycosylase RlpA family protein, partial [Geminicoccaceae bacterium]
MVRSIVMLGLVLIAVAGCSSSPPLQGTYKLGQPYQIQGRWYYPEYDPDYDRIGIASWYGEPFHGRATANGEIFDLDVVTAAHPTLPLPSLVRVTNLDNRREMVIRVNDRGPFIGDRIIDLSQEAARQLGFEQHGLAPVRVQFVGLADARGTPPRPTIRRAPVPAADPGHAALPSA